MIKVLALLLKSAFQLPDLLLLHRRGFFKIFVKNYVRLPKDIEDSNRSNHDSTVSKQGRWNLPKPRYASYFEMLKSGYGNSANI